MPLAVADLPRLVTPKQAAEVMGPTEAQVRGLIREGKLAHVMVGARIMIPREAIDQFIVQNTRGGVQCHDETKDRGSTGTATANVGTSPGLSEVAAGSAARALAIADKLKSPSPSSSTPAHETQGRVIPLRCS
jgi:excisionase family DNA binding protein